MSCKCNYYTTYNPNDDIYNTSMLGNIGIYVVEPMFAIPQFTPEVTVGNCSYQIFWGETLLLNDLILENYYNITADTVTIGNMRYTPIVSETRVQATKGDYPVITIEYIEENITESINYQIEHKMISLVGTTATVGLNIYNNGNNPIPNWNLAYCFTGNEKIVNAWNADYTQNKKSVSIYSAESNSVIYPGASINVMLEMENITEEIQVTDVLLNEQAMILTTGTTLIYVENPVFNKQLFVPTVTINNTEMEIMWGTAESMAGLPLEKPLEIEATTFTCNGITYYPVMENDDIYLTSTEPHKIYIRYYYQQASTNLQYNIDYDLSEYTDGFVCTITVTNLTAEDINGWTLDFEFLNNQEVDIFWSSEMVQDGNMVTVKPADWNTIIRGNSNISFGFQGINPAAINYPINPLLNSVSPNPRFANLEIVLPRPSYPSDEYTPTITLDSAPLSIAYGDTVNMRVVAQSIHVLKSSTEVGTKNAYLTDAAIKQIFILPNDSNTVTIDYYKAYNNPNVFSGYFASWADFGQNLATQTQMGTVAPYVTYIPIAFAKPYMDYTGSEYDLEHLTIVTGVEYGYSAQLIKDSIANLRMRSPYVKILLSLGGANYNDWEKLNAKSIAQFIKDFDLDGVDIDFEEDINAANCEPDKETGLVYCTTDDLIISIIRDLRAVLPKSDGYILSFSAWSVGAYGEGDFIDAPPSHLTTTGVMLTPLREAGNDMELMNVMAYNAVVTGQPEYDPEQAGLAYKTYFSEGISAIGAHVPPDAQGTNYWTIDKVIEAARYARDNNIGGMMLWYLQRKGEVPGSSNVDLCEAIRENLGYPEYPGPVYNGADEDDISTTACDVN